MLIFSKESQRKEFVLKMTQDSQLTVMVLEKMKTILLDNVNQNSNFLAAFCLEIIRENV